MTSSLQQTPPEQAGDAEGVEMTVLVVDDDAGIAPAAAPPDQDGRVLKDGVEATSISRDVAGGASTASPTTEGMEVSRPSPPPGATRNGAAETDLGFDVNLCSAKVRALIEDKSFFEPKADTQVWTSRLSYLLATVGSAVGLGNIWRFPYLCYRNGGATFLIPYFISLVCLGIPLFALEFTLGQGTGKGALGAFLSLDRRCGGIGVLTMLSSSGIVIYYCVILAWCLNYLISILGSLGSPLGLPWAAGAADSYYQGQVLKKTFKCLQPTEAFTHSPQSLSDTFDWTACPFPESVVRVPPEKRIWTFDQSVTASQQGCTCQSMGFENQGSLQGNTVLYLTVIYLFVFAMSCMGTKSLKYAVYITVPLPYLLLVCLFIRGVTLPGADVGIEYYLKPDMKRLFQDHTDPTTGEVSTAASLWLSAASQVFFSLSLSQGIMITYSSYNPPTFPVISNVLTVACCNSGTELFAGLCVFSILGYLAEQRGVGIEEVVQAGPGLVFEVIPEALALMPSKQLFSFLFFLMLLLLGLTSAVSLVEASIAVVRDMLSLAIRKLESPVASISQVSGGESLPSPPHPHRGAYLRIAMVLRSVLHAPWLLALCMNGLLFSCGLLLCRSSSENWVDLIDFYISNFLMTSIGVMQFAVVGWIFGMRDYAALVKYRLGLSVGLYFTTVWRFVGPCVMSIMVLAGIAGAISNPVTTVPWAAVLGWFIGIIPVLLVLASFCFFEDHNGSSVAAAVRTRFCKDSQATASPYPTLSGQDISVRPGEPEASGNASMQQTGGAELLQRNDANTYESQRTATSIPQSPQLALSGATSSSAAPQGPPPLGAQGNDAAAPSDPEPRRAA